jgi:hypothetical protein
VAAQQCMIGRSEQVRRHKKIDFSIVAYKGLLAGFVALQQRTAFIIMPVLSIAGAIAKEN